jgi:hypothetical protein
MSVELNGSVPSKGTGGAEKAIESNVLACLLRQKVYNIHKYYNMWLSVTGWNCVKLFCFFVYP